MTISINSYCMSEFRWKCWRAPALQKTVSMHEKANTLGGNVWGRIAQTPGYLWCLSAEKKRVEGLERLQKNQKSFSGLMFLVTFGALTGRRGVEGLERLLKNRRGFSVWLFCYLWCLDPKERGEGFGATAEEVEEFLLMTFWLPIVPWLEGEGWSAWSNCWRIGGVSPYDFLVTFGALTGKRGVEGLERLLKKRRGFSLWLLVTFGALTGRRGVEGLERLLKKRRGFSGLIFCVSNLARPFATAPCTTDKQNWRCVKESRLHVLPFQWVSVYSVLKCHINTSETSSNVPHT